VGIETIGLALLAGSTVAQIEQGRKQTSIAKSAARQADANAKATEKAADEAANRANQKRADPRAALDAALQSGRSGVSSTMLTGPAGVDYSALTLGKNTLLGA
jgi:hypothetical protein